MENKNPQNKPMSKTIMSASDTMVFRAETEKVAQLVESEVYNLLKTLEYNPVKLLNYAAERGIGSYKLKDAAKKLGKMGFEEGIIFEQKGIEALKLNLAIGTGFSFSTQMMFVFEDKPLDPFLVLHQFYKWYSCYKNLPGFDKISQKNFRLSMLGKINMAKLSLNELTGLQEAIKRDQEATDFALKIVKEQEGARNAMKKLKDGGANI